MGVRLSTKHISVVWVCHDGRDLQRESAFFWVLAGILVHTAFSLLLLRGWYEGRCMSERKRLPFSQGQEEPV